jgi:hypothetical protein
LRELWGGHGGLWAVGAGWARRARPGTSGPRGGAAGAAVLARPSSAAFRRVPTRAPADSRVPGRSSRAACRRVPTRTARRRVPGRSRPPSGAGGLLPLKRGARRASRGRRLLPFPSRSDAPRPAPGPAQRRRHRRGRGGRPGAGRGSRARRAEVDLPQSDAHDGAQCGTGRKRHHHYFAFQPDHHGGGSVYNAGPGQHDDIAAGDRCVHDYAPRDRCPDHIALGRHYDCARPRDDYARPRDDYARPRDDYARPRDDYARRLGRADGAQLGRVGDPGLGVERRQQFERGRPVPQRSQWSGG